MNNRRSMKHLVQLSILLIAASIKITAGFFSGGSNSACYHPYRKQNSNRKYSNNDFQAPTFLSSTNETTAGLVATNNGRGTKTLLRFQAPTFNVRNRPSFQLYCDLDGVLVDFEQGVVSLTGQPTCNLRKTTMWGHIARADAFFEHLKWTDDGPVLWNAIKHLQPDILTGCPCYDASSRTEKFQWCQDQLGLSNLHHVDMAGGFRFHRSVNGNYRQEGVTNIITCWSENKFKECRAGSVLIDDREDLGRSWENAGGIFVHHTNSANTIRQLQAHGIL